MTSTLLSRYRDIYREQYGRDDPRRDWEIVNEIATHKHAERFFEQDPGLKKMFLENKAITAPSKAEEFGTGVQRAWAGTKALGAGVVGLAGDITGNDGLRDWGVESMQRNWEEASTHESTFKFVDLFDRPQAAGQWAAGAAGELVPDVLSTAIGAIAGALVGGVTAGAVSGGVGAAPGAVGGAATGAYMGLARDKAMKWAAGRLVKDLGEKVLKETGEEFTSRALRNEAIERAGTGMLMSIGREAGQEAIDVGVRNSMKQAFVQYGAQAGLTATTALQGIGEVYGNLEGDDEEFDRGERIFASLAYGSAIGALDSVLGNIGVGRVSKWIGKVGTTREGAEVIYDGASEGLKKKFLATLWDLRNPAGEITKDMLTEGLTEVAQEIIGEAAVNHASDDRAVFDVKDYDWDGMSDQLWEAFGIGALGGGIFGGSSKVADYFTDKMAKEGIDPEKGTTDPTQKNKVPLTKAKAFNFDQETKGDEEGGDTQGDGTIPTPNPDQTNATQEATVPDATVEEMKDPDFIPVNTFFAMKGQIDQEGPNLEFADRFERFQNKFPERFAEFTQAFDEFQQFKAGQRNKGALPTDPKAKVPAKGQLSWDIGKSKAPTPEVVGMDETGSSLESNVAGDGPDQSDFFDSGLLQLPDSTPPTDGSTLGLLTKQARTPVKKVTPTPAPTTTQENLFSPTNPTVVDSVREAILTEHNRRLAEGISEPITANWLAKRKIGNTKARKKALEDMIEDGSLEVPSNQPFSDPINQTYTATENVAEWLNKFVDKEFPRGMGKAGNPSKTTWGMVMKNNKTGQVYVFPLGIQKHDSSKNTFRRAGAPLLQNFTDNANGLSYRPAGYHPASLVQVARKGEWTPISAIHFKRIEERVEKNKRGETKGRMNLAKPRKYVFDSEQDFNEAFNAAEKVTTITRTDTNEVSVEGMEFKTDEPLSTTDKLDFLSAQTDAVDETNPNVDDDLDGVEPWTVTDAVEEQKASITDPSVYTDKQAAREQADRLKQASMPKTIKEAVTKVNAKKVPDQYVIEDKLKPFFVEGMQSAKTYWTRQTKKLRFSMPQKYLEKEAPLADPTNERQVAYFQGFIHYHQSAIAKIQENPELASKHLPEGEIVIPEIGSKPKGVQPRTIIDVTKRVATIHETSTTSTEQVRFAENDNGEMSLVSKPEILPTSVDAVKENDAIWEIIREAMKLPKRNATADYNIESAPKAEFSWTDFGFDSETGKINARSLLDTFFNWAQTKVRRDENDNFVRDDKGMPILDITAEAYGLTPILMELLRSVPALEDVSVVVRDLPAPKDNPNDIVFGAYLPGQVGEPTIVLNSKLEGDTELTFRTLLHEVVHAMADYVLDMDSKYMASVKELMVLSEKLGVDLKKYRADTPKEFIAQAFTDKEFQRALSRTDKVELKLGNQLPRKSTADPTKKPTILKKFFDAVVGALKRVAGIRMNDYEASMLHVALLRGIDIMSFAKDRGWVGVSNPAGDVSFSQPTTTNINTDMSVEGREAAEHQRHIAYVHGLADVFQTVQEKTGVTEPQILEAMGVNKKADPTEKVLEAIAKSERHKYLTTAYPNIERARIGNMSESNNGLAAMDLTRRLERIRSVAVNKLVNLRRKIDTKEAQLTEDRKSLAVMVNGFKDPENYVRSMIRKVKAFQKAEFLKGELKVYEASMTEFRNRDHLTDENMARTLNTLVDRQNHTKAFDILQAMGTLGIDWNSETKPNALRLIRNYQVNPNYLALTPQNKADAAKNLDSLVNNEPLAIAMIAIAKRSELEMDLLYRRWLADTKKMAVIDEALKKAMSTPDISLDQMIKDIENLPERVEVHNRVKKNIANLRRSIAKSEQSLLTWDTNIQRLARVIPIINDKVNELDQHWDSSFNFEGNIGDTFWTIEDVNDPTGFKRTEHVLSFEPDYTQVISAAFLHNQNWLDKNKGVASTRLWNAVERMNNRLKETAVSDEAGAIFRNMFLRMTESATQKIAETNTNEGRTIVQMLKEWVALTRAHTNRLMAVGHKYSGAKKRLINALGYKRVSAFHQEIRNPLFAMLERETGLIGDANRTRVALDMVIKLMAKHEKKIPNNFTKELSAYLAAADEAATALNSLREDLGLLVEDKRQQINPLTGKRENVGRVRGIKRGVITPPRLVNVDLITRIAERMIDTGWKKDSFKELNQVVDRSQDAWADLVKQGETINSFFADDVVQEKFLKTYLSHDGFIEFKGRDIPAEQVESAWTESNGDFIQFVETLFDSLTKLGTDQDKAEFGMEILNKLQNEYIRLTRIRNEATNESGPLVNPMKASHFIVDGRTDLDLPAEFFSYVDFDPQSIHTHLSRLVSQKAFGLGGSRLVNTFNELVGKLQSQEAEAKEANDIAQEQKLRNVRMVVEAERNALDLYFNRSDFGPNQDTQLVGEILNTVRNGILNNPKSALNNLISPVTDIMVAFRGINKASITGTAGSLASFGKASVNSLLEGFIGFTRPQGEYESWVGDMFFHREMNDLSGADYYANLGRDGIYVDDGKGVAIKKIRDIQQWMNRGIRFGKRGETQWSGASIQGVFNWVSTNANWAVAVQMVRSYTGFLGHIEKWMQMNPELVSDPSYNFMKDKKGLNFVAREMSWTSPKGMEETIKQFYHWGPEYMGTTVENKVRDMIRRKANDEGPFTKTEIQRIAMIGEDQVSLNANITTRPSALLTTPGIKQLTTLWGWPIAKTNQIHQSMQDAKTHNFQVALAMKMAIVGALYVVPAGLAFSVMMDWWDIIMRGKRPNLREIDLVNQDFGSNFLAASERLARIGSYGMGGELINGIFNWQDSGAGQMPISLDQKVLAMSSFQNIYFALRNMLHQGGNPDYTTVFRPFINAIGGNGVLHAVQTLNRFVEATDHIPFAGEVLFENERRATARTNVNNILRAAGREAGFELRGFGGFSSPTPRSMWVRRMQLAAYGNDAAGFQEAYQNAVQAAWKSGRKNDPEFSYDDAVKAIKSSWRYRDPRAGVFTRKLTDQEMGIVLRVLSPGAQEEVVGALADYDRFSSYLGVGMGQTPKNNNNRTTPTKNVGYNPKAGYSPGPGYRPGGVLGLYAD